MNRRPPESNPETAKLLEDSWRQKSAEDERRQEKVRRQQAQRYAPIYATVYIMLRNVAMDNGYALAIHGTMGRDCDIVAVAWTEAAVSACALIEAMRQSLGYFEDMGIDGPERKPHGRLAWTLNIGAGGGMDVSVLGPEPVAPRGDEPR